MTSLLPPENIDQDKSITVNYLRRANEPFSFNNDEDYEFNFPLALQLVKKKKKSAKQKKSNPK